jgi:hypothetical protein
MKPLIIAAIALIITAPASGALLRPSCAFAGLNMQKTIERHCRLDPKLLAEIPPANPLLGRRSEVPLDRLLDQTMRHRAHPQRLPKDKP